MAIAFRSFGSKSQRLVHQAIGAVQVAQGQRLRRSCAVMSARPPYLLPQLRQARRVDQGQARAAVGPRLRHQRRQVVVVCPCSCRESHFQDSFFAPPGPSTAASIRNGSFPFRVPISTVSRSLRNGGSALGKTSPMPAGHFTAAVGQYTAAAAAAASRRPRLAAGALPRARRRSAWPAGRASADPRATPRRS